MRHGYRRLGSHAAFARGRMTWVRPTDATAEGRAEAAQRAESKIGHRAYSLLWNNCEHFASWCGTGTAGSQQVTEVARRVPGAPFMRPEPIRLPIPPWRNSSRSSMLSASASIPPTTQVVFAVGSSKVGRIV